MTRKGALLQRGDVFVAEKGTGGRKEACYRGTGLPFQVAGRQCLGAGCGLLRLQQVSLFQLSLVALV